MLERIRRPLDHWADFLGLAATWRITVRLADQLKLGGAETLWMTNYRDATITFDIRNVPQWDDAELEMYVLHELMHLVMADLEDSVVTAIGREGVYHNAFQPAAEQLVDRLAHTIQRLAH